jgi:hypothetical protein
VHKAQLAPKVHKVILVLKVLLVPQEPKEIRVLKVTLE